MELKELIELYLNYVDNDDYVLDKKTKTNFYSLLLYLIKLERGFTGYCSNKDCCCQTINIIYDLLNDNKLLKFVNAYKIDIKQTLKKYK